MHTREMPGMMTDEQMTDLEQAHGADFQTMWLEMMIEHHQGAIEMAAEEEQDGVFGDAVAMAKTIQSSQQDEINLMQGVLAS